LKTTTCSNPNHPDHAHRHGPGCGHPAVRRGGHIDQETSGEMAHNHNGRAHRHSHGLGRHVHAPADFGRAFAIGIALNLAYVVGETCFGVIANSLALLADAAHNLGDVLGLVAAWGASLLSQRRPEGRYTYGLRGSTILVALANAVVLLVVTGGIAWEAIRRVTESPAIAGLTIIVVALIGVVVNGATALMFMSGRKHDLNIKGAFVHMASDALIAFGVALAGAFILWTGWTWLDPAISLAIGIVIVIGTWALLRDSVNLALAAVPRGIDRNAVENYLASLPGVTAVHDLHIWGMSTTETALTAHLVRPEGPADDLLHHASHEMEHRFGIVHVTLQMETGGDNCRLAPEDVV
jgi:cobalt-zinc-cadmium efflux system protein